MGIGATLQQVEGWEGQYECLLRWYDRTRIKAQENAPEETDFVLVVLQQSYALRDWIFHACPDARVALEKLFQTSLEMRICRDVANGFKHMTLSRNASVDRAFSIVFEHNPRGSRTGEMVVLAGGHRIELLDLAGRCVEAWREFIGNNRLRCTGLASKGEVYAERQ